MFELIVETFEPDRSESRHEIRVRPVAGQGYPEDARVRFPLALRSNRQLGTKFRVLASIREPAGMRAHLNVEFADAQVVSEEEARQFIAEVRYSPCPPALLRE